MLIRSMLGFAVLSFPLVAWGGDVRNKERIRDGGSCQAEGLHVSNLSRYLLGETPGVPVRLVQRAGKPQLAGLAPGDDRPAPLAVIPLRHAHAHNDYEHKRPLFDALACGYCSVEADIFLRDGRLLVGHTPSSLKPDRTLESLYLDPLNKRAKENGGRVYRDGPPFFLLVDVKTEANPTYTALDKVLTRYADLLSVVRDGKFEERAVTIVVSGNRASELIAAQSVRYVGIDGRLTDLDSTVPAHLLPWIGEQPRSIIRT